MTKYNIKKILSENINHDDVVMEHLSNPEEQALWLQVALDEYSKDGNFNAFYASLEKVVEVRNLSVRKLAKDLDLNRGNVIKLLEGSTKTAPRLDTLTKILNYLDFEITIAPKKKVI